MRKIEENWQVRKLIQTFEQYFEPIRGRAKREGRTYLLHAFGAALDYEKLPIQRLNKDLKPTTDKPAYFLLADNFVVDLVQVDMLDEAATEACFAETSLPRGIFGGKKTTIILNFGGREPEWYPFEPEDTSVNDDDVQV